jgi:hypothetical protein
VGLDATLEFVPSDDHPSPEPPRMLGEDHSGSDDEEGMCGYDEELNKEGQLVDTAPPSDEESNVGIHYEILEMGDGFPKSIMGTDGNKYHVEHDIDSGEYVVYEFGNSDQEIIGHIDTDIEHIIKNRQ